MLKLHGSVALAQHLTGSRGDATATIRNNRIGGSGVYRGDGLRGLQQATGESTGSSLPGWLLVLGGQVEF